MATELMKDWIVELHNPERKQDPGGLGYIYDDGTKTNCCLGVLCELVGIRGEIPEDLLDEDGEPDFSNDNRVYLTYRNRAEMPPTDVIDKVLGVDEPQGDDSVSFRINEDDDEKTRAESANDELELSFKEIAGHLSDEFLSPEEQFEVRKRIEDNGWA